MKNCVWLGCAFASVSQQSFPPQPAFLYPSPSTSHVVPPLEEPDDDPEDEPDDDPELEPDDDPEDDEDEASLAEPS